MNSRHTTIALILLLCGQPAIFANMSEFFTIFSMYLKKPNEVGEIAPLSSLVAKALVKHVGIQDKNNTAEGKYYLEAGGGCGAISICIAQQLRPCDHLDVIEINPDLCQVLIERLKQYPNVMVHCCSILDWHPGYQYDAIISTLPFLSLGIDFAKNTMSYFQQVAAKGCILSCVEYPIAVVFRKVMRNLRIKDADFVAVQKYMASVRKKIFD